MLSIRNLFVLVVLLCSWQAHAGFFSGNDIKKELDNNNSFGFGYVIGAADAMGGQYICLPGGESGVRAGQIRDVVHKYLRENPTILHEAADLLVLKALVGTWPCKKKSTEPETTPPPQRRPPPKPKEESSPF